MIWISDIVFENPRHLRLFVHGDPTYPNVTIAPFSIRKSQAEAFKRNAIFDRDDEGLEFVIFFETTSII